jgi:hypothetical protein
MGHLPFFSMVRVIVKSAARRDVTIYAFSPAAIGNQCIDPSLRSG